MNKLDLQFLSMSAAFFAVLFLPAYQAQALTVEEATLEITSSVTKVNQLFGSGIDVRFHEEGLPEHTGGFSAEGFSSTDGMNGAIHAGIPNIKSHLEKYPDTFTADTVAFVATHEAAHVLLGHVTTEFVGRVFPPAQPMPPLVVFEMLGNRMEEDADGLAAKIMAEFGRPLESTLAWNLALGQLRHPETRNPLIQYSAAERWKTWFLHNRMGPLCRNLLADLFAKRGAEPSLVRRLRSDFCS